MHLQRISIALVLLILVPARAGAALFFGLGDLPGEGFHSEATAVSADGLTVVGWSESTSGIEAFRWDRTNGMVGLGGIEGGPAPIPVYPLSKALGVSADGSVIVGEGVSATAGVEAFRWDQTNGMVGLGFLSETQYFSKESRATGVSADGSVVVGSSSTLTGATHAFRWNSTEGMAGLGWTGGDSFATAVSANGIVIAGFGEIEPTTEAPSGTREAFRWDPANELVGLGGFRLDSPLSRAFGVSADGSVIVGDAISEFVWPEASRWDAVNEILGLGKAGGQSSTTARATSADGSVVVGDGRGDGQSPLIPNAVIWDSVSGIQRLDLLLASLGVDLAGWRLEAASGISADGRTIVGYGTNPSGETEAWIVVIPEPRTALLVVVGLAGLATIRPRKGPGGPDGA